MCLSHGTASLIHSALCCGVVFLYSEAAYSGCLLQHDAFDTKCNVLKCMFSMDDDFGDDFGLPSSDDGLDLGPPGVPAVSDDDEDLGPPGVPPASPLEDLGPPGVIVARGRGRPPKPVVAAVALALLPAPVPVPPPDSALEHWLLASVTIGEDIVDELGAAILDCLTVPARHRKEAVRDQVLSICDHVFGLYARPASSRLAEAIGLGVRYDTFTSHLREIVGTTFTLARMSLSAACMELRSAIQAGLYEVLFGITQTVNDETCIRLRTATATAETPTAGNSHQGVPTKVLQTEAQFALQLRQPNGTQLLLVFRMPTLIQHMDHNTADTLHQCTQDVWNIHAVQGLLSECPRVIHLTTNDRAASNLRCEKFMRMGKPITHHRLRTTCDVHKGHTSQGHQFDLQKSLISGVINVGVAMQAGGSLESLRCTLRLYFAARLRFYRHRRVAPPGSPQHDFREASLALYLDKSTADALRELTLRRMLNGDWTVRRIVEHHCNGCCENFDMTLATFQGLVTDALLPGICPIFPRSRWVGAQKTLRWCGLLCAVHGIFEEVLPVWLRGMGDASKPATLEDFRIDDDADEIHEVDMNIRGVQHQVAEFALVAVGDEAAAPQAFALVCPHGREAITC